MTLRCLDSSQFGIRIENLFRDKDALQKTSIEGDIWVDGTYIMQTIIVLVNVKLFISTSSHTSWSVILQLGCIVAFYAYLYVFTYIPFDISKIVGVGRALLLFVENYLLLFITVIAFSFIDVGMWHLDQQVQLAYEAFEEGLEQQYQIDRSSQTATKNKKITDYKHRGYAFDGAAGHDVLVTDNLFRRIRYAMDAQLSAKMSPFGVNKWSDGSSLNMKSVRSNNV